MNKKFFTLLVALFAMISFGTSAQTADVKAAAVTTNSYTVGKTYLLGTGAAAGGSEKGYFLAVDNDQLVLVKGVPQTLAALELASWKVSASTSSYVFTNASTGVVLSLDKANAAIESLVTAPSTYEIDWTAFSNVLGGDVDAFVPTSASIKPQLQQFFVNATGDKLYGLSANNDFSTIDGSTDTHPAKLAVGLVLYVNEARMKAQTIEFTPFLTTGTISLSANDLNTQLGKSGIYDETMKKLAATLESEFNFSFSPKTTRTDEPLDLALQAQAIERHELLYGSDTKHIWFSSDGSADKIVGKPSDADKKDGLVMTQTGRYLSMYPLGTREGKPEQAVKDEAQSWVTLYIPSKKAYLVVDTVYHEGTGQSANPRIQLGFDGLYNAKNSTKYRLPESYLFKFEYNASSQTINMVSAGYLTTHADDKGNSLVTTTTPNAHFYSGTTNFNADPISTPANAYNIPPVKAKSFFPNGAITSGAAVITGSAPTLVDAVVDANEAKKGLGVNLTYAKLASTVLYTFSKKDDVEEDFVVRLSDPKKYEIAKVANGAYILKVKSVFDTSKNSGRVGKYLKMSLDGRFEYVEKAPRQNFQHMPAAQWVFETTGSSSNSKTKITNREFSYPFGTAAAIYKGSDNSEIFYMGGDTLVIEKVTDVTTPTQGYKVADPELNELYVFKYLHELSLDQPVNSKKDADSAVWVDNSGEAMRFTLELVTENEKYGYATTAVKQLTRNVYKVKATDHYEFAGRYLTYNKDTKKYYLTTDAKTATEFYLKENNEREIESGKNVCYYTFVEVNYISDMALAKWDSKAGKHVPADPSSTTKYRLPYNNLFKAEDFAYVAGAKGKYTTEGGVEKESWVPKVFTFDAIQQIPAHKDENGQYALYIYAGSRTITVEGAPKTVYDYYRAYPYNNSAISKVSVDNNTLALTYGVLSDYDGYEVANSAFSVEIDDAPLYRDLGEKLTVAKIFRMKSEATGKEYLYEDANSVYSTPVNGADTPDRVSQINFLGVEGKGMTKNSAMNIRYQRGVIMPQYLIGFDFKDIEGTPGEVCSECQGLDENCPHNTKGTAGYMAGRFLVSLADSVAAYTGADKEKFQLEKKYTRLAFVEGKLVKDEKDVESLVITSSALEAKKNTIDVSSTMENSKEGVHTPVLFSFRLMNDEEAADFMIESKANAVAGQTGEWVKIQNGVPVLTGSISLTDAMGNNEAEIFNLEVTDENPTSNGMIDAAKVNVVAGQGYVTIKGAAGQQVVVANILGQVVANVVLDKDEATIAAPAGVVVVSVNGVATKALVK